MSIHPNVISACPAKQGKSFTTLESLKSDLEKVVEAWLRDDQWFPQFFYGAQGPGAPIVAGFLPEFTTSDELLAQVVPTICAHRLSVVAFLVPARRRELGVKPSQTPNQFVLQIMTRDGRDELVAWDMESKSDGTVLSWGRSEGRAVAAGFSSRAVFLPDAN